MRFFMIALILAAVTGWAQNLDDQLDIKITAMKMSKSKTPKTVPAIAGVAPDTKTEFLRVDVEYEVVIAKGAKIRANQQDDLWLSECVFAWKVVLCGENERRDASERKSIRMAKLVTYGNVEIGPGHRAVIFIEPRIYDRFRDRLIDHGKGIFVEVSASINGKTRAKGWMRGTKATLRSNEAKKFFPRTRSKQTWFFSEDVAESSFGLLSKAETPWRDSSLGAFEYIVEYE
ncbi:MAG: hypothetical protein ACKJSG_12715 [Lentisphaeria bacterium]|jgi:hypothetical protein